MMPLPMLDRATCVAEVVDFLYRWQTLIGAFLGTLGGLFAALLVAHSARRREEIISAMLAIRDLTEFIAMKDVCDRLYRRSKRHCTTGGSSHDSCIDGPSSLENSRRHRCV